MRRELLRVIEETPNSRLNCLVNFPLMESLSAEWCLHVVSCSESNFVRMHLFARKDHAWRINVNTSLRILPLNESFPFSGPESDISVIKARTKILGGLPPVRNNRF